jgi:glycosyltransferase involved in cell wall biosynthesis
VIYAKKRNVCFHLTIYGSGELDVEMKQYIEKHQLLEDLISMPGSVDFYNKLLPDFKEKVDLFVCLHRQSDPSCTYLETLSCGIPIVGYNNKAFAGLLRHADIGWGAKLNDLQEIVNIIENLDKDRARIAEKSKNSLVFCPST